MEAVILEVAYQCEHPVVAAQKTGAFLVEGNLVVEASCVVVDRAWCVACVEAQNDDLYKLKLIHPVVHVHGQSHKNNAAETQYADMYYRFNS